jgi:uncharacterized protein YebE (UPF0316 family)
MQYDLFLYFLAGIIQDFLFTLSLRYVSKEKALLASSVAFFDNLVSVGVLYTILRQLDSQRTVISIIVYSLGIATGTFLAMKFKLGMKNVQ